MNYTQSLIEQKGTKEWIIIDNERILEKIDIYKNYHYLIIFNPIGFRCAYISIPPGNYFL